MSKGKTAVVAIMVSSVFILSACTKTETTDGQAPDQQEIEAIKKDPEQHKKEMIRKSFEESKKALAARVNGEPITMFSLLQEMNIITPQYVKAGQAPTREQNAAIRDHALNTLVVQTLAVQEARRLGMKADSAIIDKEINRMRVEAGSADAFSRNLADTGITEKELRDAIEQDILFEMIAAREIDAKVKVSESALRVRFDQAKKDSNHQQMTFEAARPMLEQKALEEAAEKRMRQWEKELKKKAKVEILVGQ